MTINLTDLKAEAEAATPGEWQVGQPDHNDQPIIRNEHIEIATLWHHSLESILLEAKANAAYIAAASPAAMLPLIDALIEWRDAREQLGKRGMKTGLMDAVERMRRADEALIDLISGKPTQETTP